MRQRSTAVRMGFIGLLAFTVILFGCDSPAGGGDDNTTYTITYDGNGADSGSAPSSQTKTEGSDLTLSSNSGNLARDGYSFAGWNTAADGSGTSYAEAATYSADADVTLHAKWTGNQYTVTFEKQDGIGGSTSVDATFDAPMPSGTAPTKTGFLFDGYYTGINGTGRQYYTAGMESARNWDLTSNTELIASWVDYEIGDTGQAGGIVFYDKGSYSDGWRYLEVAPSDIGVSTDYTHVWGGYGTEVGASAQGTAIGTGETNTAAIVDEYGSSDPQSETGDYAARLADQYTHGGYDDWFLPSKDELHVMYQNKAVIGGLSSDNYWSSSESTPNTAWGYDFGNDYHVSNSKPNTGRVRAVRAF